MINLLGIQVKKIEVTAELCLYQNNNRVVKSSWQALKLIGCLSEVVVLLQLLLRIKEKAFKWGF